MKRNLAFVIFFSFLCAINSYAQNDPQWNLGFRGAGMAGVNEAVHQSLKPQFNIYALWLNGISPDWSVEGSIGFVGSLASSNQGGFSEYSTDILPIDFKVRYSPLENSDWQPYLYAGIGLIHYNVTSKPSNISPDANPEGTSLFFPVGIGLRHPGSFNGDRFGNLLVRQIYNGEAETRTDQHRLSSANRISARQRPGGS